jgi:hypothetical protein
MDSGACRFTVYNDAHLDNMADFLVTADSIVAFTATEAAEILLMMLTVRSVSK